MARYTHQDQFTIQGINSQLEQIDLELRKMLSREGEAPNSIEADIDFNSKRLYNLPEATTETEPLRKKEGDGILAGATAQADRAEQEADKATASAIKAYSASQAASISEADAEQAAAQAKGYAGTTFASGKIIPVDGLKSLDAFTTNLVNRLTFDVQGLIAGTEIGGGRFIYDSSRDKSTQNGGTVVAPEAIEAWDGTLSDIDTLHNWSGAGLGCYVMQVGEELSSDVFGVQDGMNITSIFNSMCKAAVGRVLKFNNDQVDAVIVDDVTVEDTSLEIDFNNVKVLSNNGNPTLFFNYNHVDPIDINSVSIEDGRTKINAATTSHGYKAGELIKVASMDEIPTSYEGNRMVGEWAYVASVTGASILLDRRLYDHSLYSTSIRAAKMSNHYLTIRNHVSQKADDASTDIPYGTVRVAGAVRFKAYNMKASKLNSAYLRLEGLYKPEVEYLEATDFALNSDVGGFGYGLVDFGCHEGVFREISGSRVRHTYTNNAWPAGAAMTFSFNFGRPFRNKVIGGVSHGREQACYDTHTEAVDTEFVDNEVIGGALGWQSRTVGTKFIRPKFSNVNRAFQFIGADGITYGINNWADNVIIDPSGTYNDKLYRCTLSSAFDGEGLIRGPIRIEGVNATRGTAAASSGVIGLTSHPVIIEISGQCTLEDAAGFHLFRFNGDNCKFIMRDFLINIESNPTPYAVRIAFNTGATGGLVEAYNLTVNGAAAGIRNIVDGMDLRKKNVAIENVDSFVAVTNGTEVTWGYNSEDAP